MDITFGIKTEDAAAYLNEMEQLPPPEIKSEDVKIEIDWVDDGVNAIDGELPLPIEEQS